MHSSNKAIDLIKHFEGLRLSAYRCAGGVWTVGYGHTGSDISKSTKITKAKADELLLIDIGRTEQLVNELISCDLEQREFDALVSFTFNVGGGALRDSTLRKLANQNDKQAVPAQLMRWVFAQGKRLTGLVTRRHAECGLWLGTDDATGIDIKSAGVAVQQKKNSRT